MVATTIQGTILDLLKNSPHLTDLLGAGDDARVFPVREYQDATKDKNGKALPYITFNLEGNERPAAFGKDTGLCFSRYQFNCWASSFQTATDVAEGLRLTIQRYRDTAGANGVKIQDCFPMGDLETWDEDVESFAVLVNYQIIWEEGTP